MAVRIYGSVMRMASCRNGENYRRFGEYCCILFYVHSERNRTFRLTVSPLET